MFECFIQHNFKTKKYYIQRKQIIFTNKLALLEVKLKKLKLRREAAFLPVWF
jgi:hypothetical protein